MHLPTIAAALLLPLLAAADGPNTATATSTYTQTKTVTLTRAHTVTSTSSAYGFNGTATYYPTGSVGPTGCTTTSFTAAKTTGSPSPSISPISKSAGAAVGATHVFLAGVAGMAVVALM